MFPVETTEYLLWYQAVIFHHLRRGGEPAAQHSLGNDKSAALQLSYASRHANK